LTPPNDEPATRRPVISKRGSTDLHGAVLLIAYRRSGASSAGFRAKNPSGANRKPMFAVVITG